MSLHHTTTGDSRHHQLLCEQFLYFHLMLCWGRKPWPDLWGCPWHRFLQSKDHILCRKTVADRGFEGLWFWWGFCARIFSFDVWYTSSNYFVKKSCCMIDFAIDWQQLHVQKFKKMWTFLCLLQGYKKKLWWWEFSNSGKLGYHTLFFKKLPIFENGFFWGLHVSCGLLDYLWIDFL